MTGRSSPSHGEDATPNTPVHLLEEWLDRISSRTPHNHVEVPRLEISSQGQAHYGIDQGQTEPISFRPQATANVSNTGDSSTEGLGIFEAGTGGLGVFGNGGAAKMIGDDMIWGLASRLEDLSEEVQRLSLQALEQRPVIDSGMWNTRDVRSYEDPQTHTEGRVTFSREFKSVPTVVVSINAADVSKEHNFRVRTYATAVDTKGFVVHVDSWDDTLIYSCGVSWIAMEE
ncbi:hypothetical protein F5X97DRAFT_346553 [Nemania serpens]|nr:hypothetical protein F5X97DRAFT_346553 [Nemania serpens]